MIIEKITKLAKEKWVHEAKYKVITEKFELEVTQNEHKKWQRFTLNCREKI